MKTDYNPILKPLAFALYMTMSAVMLNSLYTGPWSKLMRNSTYLVEDFPLLKDFRAEHHDVNFSPSVSLCAIPGRKSGERRFDWTKHENFTGDFLDLARDVMFTEVAEILVLLELDQNTLHKKNVLNSIKFQRFMADDQAALMCHYFIPGHYHNLLEGYSLNLGFKNQSYQDPTYSLVFSAPGEHDLMSGIINLPQAKVTTLTVRRGFVSSINIDYEYHVRIRNCDPNNTGLSRCVMNFLDKTIGACNLLSRQGGSGEGEEEECNVRKFKARASRIFAFKIEGYEYTRSVTGCLVPCHEVVYTTSSIFTDDLHHVDQLTTDSSYDYSAFAIFKAERKKRIRTLTEQYSYDISSFISDVGGLMGLFLGLSFWGVFGALLEAWRWIRPRCPPRINRK